MISNALLQSIQQACARWPETYSSSHNGALHCSVTVLETTASHPERTEQIVGFALEKWLFFARLSPARHLKNPSHSHSIVLEELAANIPPAELWRPAERSVAHESPHIDKALAAEKNEASILGRIWFQPASVANRTSEEIAWTALQFDAISNSGCRSVAYLLSKWGAPPEAVQQDWRNQLEAWKAEKRKSEPGEESVSEPRFANHPLFFLVDSQSQLLSIAEEIDSVWNLHFESLKLESKPLPNGSAWSTGWPWEPKPIASTTALPQRASSIKKGLPKRRLSSQVKLWWIGGGALACISVLVFLTARNLVLNSPQKVSDTNSFPRSQPKEAPENAQSRRPAESDSDSQADSRSKPLEDANGEPEELGDLVLDLSSTGSFVDGGASTVPTAGGSELPNRLDTHALLSKIQQEFGPNLTPGGPLATSELGSENVAKPPNAVNLDPDGTQPSQNATAEEKPPADLVDAAGIGLANQIGDSNLSGDTPLVDGAMTLGVLTPATLAPPNANQDELAAPEEESFQNGVKRSLSIRGSSIRVKIGTGESFPSSTAQCEAEWKIAESLLKKCVLTPTDVQTWTGRDFRYWTLAAEDEDPEVVVVLESKPARSWELHLRVLCCEQKDAPKYILEPNTASVVVNRLLTLQRWVHAASDQNQKIRDGVLPRGRIDPYEQRRTLARHAKELEKALERWRILERLSQIVFEHSELVYTLRAQVKEKMPAGNAN